MTRVCRAVNTSAVLIYWTPAELRLTSTDRLDQTSAAPQACRFSRRTLCGAAQRGRWRRRRGVRGSWTYACDTFADRIAKRAART